MSKYTYIPDGYTLYGYLAESSTHGPVHFRYRPAIAAERTANAEQVDMLKKGADWEQAERKAAEFACGKLLAWDISHDGKVLPITPETFLRLNPTVGGKLYLVISGLRASDTPPEGAPAPKFDERAEAGN